MTSTGTEDRGGKRNISPVRIKVPTVDEILNGHDLFQTTEDALRAEHLKPKPIAPDKPSQSELVRNALTGGDGVSFGPKVDLTAANPDAELVAREVAAETAKQAVTGWDSFKAAYSENLVVKMVYAIGASSAEYDPKFMERYRKDWQGIEAFAQDDDEVGALREATSDAHLSHIKEEILTTRENTKLIEASRSPTVLRLGVNATLLLPFLFLLIAWKRRKPMAS